MSITTTDALAALLNPSNDVVRRVADNMTAIKSAMSRDNSTALATGKAADALVGLSKADIFVVICSLLHNLAVERSSETDQHATILAAAMVAYTTSPAGKRLTGTSTASGAESDPWANIDTTKAN